MELLEVLAVEECGGLLKRAVLRLDDEEVEERELEREPYTVDNLCKRQIVSHITKTACVDDNVRSTSSQSS